MDIIHFCDTPLGRAMLAGDGEALVGLWFDGQRHFAAGLSPERREGWLPVFGEAERWMELYFSGREPGFTPRLCFRGTAFCAAVWKALLDIPYGRTATYGGIAATLDRTSARAVGGAVARNPISLIVPCHRVVGADGSLTGYAGGLDRKRKLLALEGAL